MPEIVFNFHNRNDRTITILLGIEKHILFNFRYNNIQLTVGNEFDFYPEQLEPIAGIIAENGFLAINILGLSKTCTAGVVYASKLAERFVDTPIHLFCFSPYSTIREVFYRERKLLERIPRSLSIMWKKQEFSENFYLQRDIRYLQSFPTVRTSIIFPRYGVHCEPECAEPYAADENVTLIPLDLSSHAVLSLFWRKPGRNLKIEIFENEFNQLGVEEFWYFREFQKRFTIQESLYSLLFDQSSFLEELGAFQEKLRSREIPVLFTLEFTCRDWLAQAGRTLALLQRKTKNRLSKIAAHPRNLKERAFERQNRAG